MVASVIAFNPVVSFLQLGGDYILLSFRWTAPADNGSWTTGGMLGGSNTRFTTKLATPARELGGLVKDLRDGTLDNGQIEQTFYIDLLADSSVETYPGTPVAPYECAFLIDIAAFKLEYPDEAEFRMDIWGAQINGKTPGDLRIRAELYQDVDETSWDLGRDHPGAATTYKGKEYTYVNERDPQFFGPPDKLVSDPDNPAVLETKLEWKETNGEENPYPNRGNYITDLVYDLGTTITFETDPTPTE